MKPSMYQHSYGKWIVLVRAEFDLTQPQFWHPLGVSQSAGCRYETGSRSLPGPLRKLVEINEIEIHGAGLAPLPAAPKRRRRATA